MASESAAEGSLTSLLLLQRKQHLHKSVKARNSI